MAMQKMVTSRQSAKLAEVTQERLLTILDVGKILGVSRPTVYELINHEGLPTVKLRKRIRVIPLSFYQWLADREQVK